MNVVIIGTGNVATQLGRLIYTSGHHIVQVYGRDRNAADLLAKEWQATAISDLKQMQPKAELYIMAVADSALPVILKDMIEVKGVLVHTAGAVPIDLLQTKASRFGVLYPLQSLRKESEKIPEIPFLVEGSDVETGDWLKTFAGSLSDKVALTSETTRQKMHVAAVFVNNFVNHLYTITRAYCKRESIEFQLLIPLIQETAQRLTMVAPEHSQTGPAVRNDSDTIERHQALLATNPEMLHLYQLFTQQIMAYHHPEQQL